MPTPRPIITAERRRDARERERRGGHPEDPEGGGHAQQRGEDGQARGQHAAEAEQQHHDGHHDADQLRPAVLGFGPGGLAERAAVADRDPGRAGRGHRPVHLGDVTGAQGGRVLAEVDHVVGGPPVGRGGPGRQRVARGQHVRQRPDVRDRTLDRAALAGQGARADTEHQLPAQPARLRLMLGQQRGAGLGRGARQREVVVVGPAERAVAEGHPGQHDHPEGHHRPGMAGAPAAKTAEAAEHDVVVAVSRGGPGARPAGWRGGRVRTRRICHDCHYVKNCQS